MDTKGILRRAAGTLFLGSNINLLAWNLDGANTVQLAAAACMAACSVGIMLSATRPKWLMFSGSSLIAGQTLIGVSAQGPGALITQMGVVPPILQGALLVRAGWQSVSKQTYKAKGFLTKPFEIIDRYPLAAAGIIEAPGTAAIAVGAALSHDWDLAATATGWTVANICLAASDPGIRIKDRPAP
jgi:hypothetical protein